MSEPELRQVEPGSPLLPVIYRELLVPTFPPEELGPLSDLADGLAAGTVLVSALVDGAGRPVGVAVGEWSPASGVLLLAYLAVRPGSRSGGAGGRLLGEVTGSWRQRLSPTLILAELEHPAAHPADPVRGDPAARLRFYARHGVQALDLPFFQPALGAGGARVYGLVLALLAQAGRRRATVAAAPVRAFLTEYFLGTEGGVGADPASAALWRALDRRAGIRLLPLTDPARLPLSTPPP